VLGGFPEGIDTRVQSNGSNEKNGKFDRDALIVESGKLLPGEHRNQQTSQVIFQIGTNRKNNRKSYCKINH
jgi:hypothetical protein